MKSGRARGARTAMRSDRARDTAAPPPDQALSWFYWSLPFVLTGLQYWVSATAMHQIRGEELAESVRNVFWLNHRLVYDGISSNVGWYGLLLASYKLFGFSLYSAKFVRLGLHLVGLLAAASVLRQFMGPRTAAVPLIAIGLSPTLLYLETLQTSYGIDLPYAAICLWLLLSVRPSSRAPSELVKTFACGVTTMIAAMSYPTFLLYLPSFALVAFWWMCRGGRARESSGWGGWHAVSGAAGLAVPLAVAFLFVATPGLLLWDPATQAGLFRGGGVIGFDSALLRQSMSAVLGDLFVEGRTYYFELTRPDFAGPLAVTGLLYVAASTLVLWIKRHADRTILTAVVLLLGLNLVVPSLAVTGGPGIRRASGILAAGFALFALVWQFHRTWKPARVWIHWVGLAACLLVPFASALKFPSLLHDMASESRFRNTDWFAIAETPTKSLEALVRQLDNGQALSCPIDEQRRIIPCRYQEVYAASAGYRRWNSGVTAEVYGLDWKTGNLIVLTPALWASYYYPH